MNDADITAMATFLGLGEAEFIERYTRLRPQRDGLALLEKPNGECVFLEGIDCVIQPVKPHQCAGFPNAWNFPGWRKVCEAVEVPLTGDARVVTGRDHALRRGSPVTYLQPPPRRDN